MLGLWFKYIAPLSLTTSLQTTNRLLLQPSLSQPLSHPYRSSIRKQRLQPQVAYVNHGYPGLNRRLRAKELADE